MHVFVHFASRAELGLTIWEQAVLDFKENASTSSKLTYNQCTADFIRACTKLCVPGADEKSGYVSFTLTFLLKDLENPCDLKMTTFHGQKKINVGIRSSCLFPTLSHWKFHWLVVFVLVRETC